MLPILVHTIMAARFLVHTHSYSSECIFHIQVEGNTLNKICLTYMRLRCNAKLILIIDVFYRIEAPKGPNPVYNISVNQISMYWKKVIF